MEKIDLNNLDKLLELGYHFDLVAQAPPAGRVGVW